MSTPASDLPAQHNLPAYSVSEISGAVKSLVEGHLGYVRVRGEISGFKLHTASGHAYLSLKDDKAVLGAVCWKGSLAKVRASLPGGLQDGLEVIATGRMTTFPGQSKYQLVIESVEPAGVGALMALLEQLKQKLTAEGLFAQERKRILPVMPRVIGVVTSPTGAVIRDILHRLSERLPCHVLVWPVAVQGQGAAQQVAAAIDGFNSLNPESRIPTPDLLIVARGGGSIEDLWAFNEEVVVRAAAASAIPLISAVGHETDTTLIDYASDMRAPTPTAAAEFATPLPLWQAQDALAQQEARLRVDAQKRFALLAERVHALSRGLPKPEALLAQAMQRLDVASDRLNQALPTWLERQQQRLAVLSASLKPRLLVQDIARKSEQVANLAARQKSVIERLLADRARGLDSLSRMLATLDVRQTLKRGFVMVKRADTGALVTSSAASSREMTLTFHDGTVEVMMKRSLTTRQVYEELLPP